MSTGPLLSLLELQSDYDVSHGDVVSVMMPATPTVDPVVDLMTRLVSEPREGAPEELAKLPDGFRKLSNIRISLEHPVPHNGSNIHSAQFDHIVVGARRIIVVEVKNWEKTTHGLTKYNPVVQTKREALALWVHLKERLGLSFAVRGLVVSAQGDLDIPNMDKQIKVLRVDELLAEISRVDEGELGRGAAATAEHIPEIVACLQEADYRSKRSSGQSAVLPG